MLIQGDGLHNPAAFATIIHEESVSRHGPICGEAVG